MRLFSKVPGQPALSLASALAYLPALAIMAAIFVASDMHGQDVPLPGFFASDKLAHFCVYALLGLAIGYRPRIAAMLRKPPSEASSAKSVALPANPWLGFVIGCLYALSDEWHQSFVPGRQAGWDDWVADALGIAFGIWFSHRQVRRYLLHAHLLHAHKSNAGENSVRI